MTEAEIYDRLVVVFRDVFDDDEIVISPETTAPDVDGWDSLNHIRLILSIGREFGVQFSASEVAGFKNVGDLVSAIARKA